MRIKSPDDGVTEQAFLTRDPRDPLPDPHEGTIMQNGHMKETSLLADVRGQRLDSRNGSHQQQANGEAKVNGQNHVTTPTVIRTDHEMAVRTKVISVKRNIQPSNQDHRSKPPLTPSNSFNSKNKPPATTALHGQTRKQSTDEQTTPRTEPTPTLNEQFTFSDSSSPTSPMSPSAMSYNSQLDNGDVKEGINGRHSSTSSTSMPYPVSPLPHQSPNYFNVNPPRLQRQTSSYERTISADLDRLNGELAQGSVSSAPKFIKDTSAYWYKPDISREQALAILRDRSPGSFVVRDSRCFPGAFGLALKVDRLPPAVQPKPGLNLTNEYVRHFLIELSSKGVKLKGCPNEPVFGSLSALVYQHSITPLALPCKLIIPTEDQEVPPTPDSPTNQSDTIAALELLKQGAACNVVYIGTMDMESLTGPMAIENAISKTVAEAKSNPNKTSTVHFKVSPQGITLTDNQRKIFFRRHYPTATVTFCGLDPLGSGSKKQKARRWDATVVKGGREAWMFGFVARKQIGSNDNQCHVFAELDSTQPARAIVNFVTKILIGSHRQNNA